MRANCTRRIPPTKLAVILHNLAHQLFEEVLTGHEALQALADEIDRLVTGRGNVVRLAAVKV